MPSRLAARIIGETEENLPSRSSVAAEWFNSLGSEVQNIVAEGNVDKIEIRAMVFLVKDKPYKAGDDYAQWTEYSDRIASWEETQNPELRGGWQVTYDSNTPPTAFSLYAKMTNGEDRHIEDFKTYEEAQRKGSAISALLGVEIDDLVPEKL